MARRQFLNDPDEFVREALEGLVLAHPSLELHTDPTYVVRAARGAPKVALVSGGGSGHEPLHSGFVGTGMLDAAVPGAVFASPTVLQVTAATTAADFGHGVLQIVKNYTGDVLNFQIAGEISAEEGTRVERVLVDDDLATDTGDGDGDGPGRRGTGATLVVEKVCGAAAEAGAMLDELALLGRHTVARSRSMAVALSGAAHPGSVVPSFELPDDEVELGVGIHGERAATRAPFGTARELMRQLVDPLVADLKLRRGDGVLVFVNGMGATHPLELSVCFREVHRALGECGVEVTRSLVGTYLTSLDMAGVSLTLTRADDELLRLWDAPVCTPALVW
ncbi:MAG TPA: dihydroxyacetone kinase subunit DhaK [Pseudonocardiaceae bacterium]|nr:dihydroxyacetone kinase subunit DhaK [Pseudonocardiaceae bacterium]